MTAISVAYIRERLIYRSSTGELIWKRHPDQPLQWNARYANTVAGTICKGARMVSIRKRPFISSHVIWALVTGEWPAAEIDHIDHNPLNNRWNNLRAATSQQNKFNTRTKRLSKSGFKWVRRAGSRWHGEIRVNGHKTFVGSFDSPEDAHAACYRLACEHHKQFACGA